MSHGKKTILMSEHPSHENWEPSFGKKVRRVLRHLASSVHDFGLEHKFDPGTTVVAGRVKGAGAPRRAHAGTEPFDKTNLMGVKVEHNF